MQQLEKAGFVKQVDIQGHKGRIITAQGKKFLDTVAVQIVKQKPKQESTPKESLKEEKAEAPKQKPHASAQKEPAEKTEPKQKPAKDEKVEAAKHRPETAHKEKTQAPKSEKKEETPKTPDSE